MPMVMSQLRKLTTMTIEHHKQVSLLDCGLACTKTLLSFFEISSENINESFNVKSTQGMSLLDIENVLKKYNISSNSYKIDDIKSLRQIERPFIAVVERNSLPHYIVIINVTENKLTISDPAFSKISTKKIDEFNDEFLGIILIPELAKECLESLNTHEAKEDVSSELYCSFISNLKTQQKFLLVCTGISRIILPMVIALFLQYILTHVFLEETQLKVLTTLVILFVMFIYYVITKTDTKLKTIIENDFLQKTIEKYYCERLYNYENSKNYDFVMGYFWNLLTSASGVIHKFYLSIYLFMLMIIILCLLSLNLSLAILTICSLVVLFFYNYKKLSKIEENQRKYVIASSNFTYLVESSIDGLYDISANKKEESFKKEFIEKIKSLLTVKLEAAELSNCIFTSISIYIIGLATCILIFSNLYRFETSYVDNSNIILLISLLTTILQPILTTWLSYSRSRFSLEYISMKDKGNFISSKDIYSLGITEIESIKIEGLSMQYLDKTIFNDININLEKGSLYVITGDNGSGKSTFLKILQGFITPTKGKIIINNSEYKTLKHTNICDYIGIYSNEFRLFAGSIDKNINFDLFNISSGINYKENKFIGLPLSYQIDSQGKNVSLGQKQRTLILRSLSDDSKDIFLLDEPTSNLDKSSKQQLKEMIVRLLKKKKIICIVTHDEEFIELATNIIHLNK